MGLDASLLPTLISLFTATLPSADPPPATQVAGRGFRIRAYASILTTRWWANVARVFSVRKKMYCTMIGVFAKEEEDSEVDFSIRAQER